MRHLIKPRVLHPGDTVATISLSWGGAGLYRERYKQGKRQFEAAFGVHVIETPHALASPEEIYTHPEWRLDDLMGAFSDDKIKAILTNIGGDDTIRLLPLMTEQHFRIIHDNPKIFMGMSDTTVNHFMCFKAGLSSFYSPCLLFGYAENGGIPDYMIQNTKKVLFSTEPIGVLPESQTFIVDLVLFGKENVVRKREASTPWRYIGGRKTVRGRLIGGCADSLFSCMNGTVLFPEKEVFEDSVLFLETSEDRPTPEQLIYWLRILGVNGILERLKGILLARPGGEFLPEERAAQESWIAHYADYDQAVLKVLNEFGRPDMPVVTNMDFGHTVPQLILPYGVLCEINPEAHKVCLLESGVIE